MDRRGFTADPMIRSSYVDDPGALVCMRVDTGRPRTAESRDQCDWCGADVWRQVSDLDWSWSIMCAHCACRELFDAGPNAARDMVDVMFADLAGLANGIEPRWIIG